MRKQFDSCSYKELTGCVKARIEWIREKEKFLSDPLSKNYPHIKATIRLKILIEKSEIRRLLKMRRILKGSGLKNWDSDYFGDVY